jgi:hypothetical protein
LNILYDLGLKVIPIVDELRKIGSFVKLDGIRQEIPQIRKPAA